VKRTSLYDGHVNKRRHFRQFRRCGSDHEYRHGRLRGFERSGQRQTVHSRHLMVKNDSIDVLNAGSEKRVCGSSSPSTSAPSTRLPEHSRNTYIVVIFSYLTNRKAHDGISRRVRRVRTLDTRPLRPRPNRARDLKCAKCPGPPRHLFDWDAYIVRQPFPSSLAARLI